MEQLKNQRINDFKAKLKLSQNAGLDIKKIGNDSGVKKVNLTVQRMGDVEVRKKESMSSLNSDLTNYPTLPSDSSPFMEKYEIDEDLELLGEGTHSIVRECISKLTGTNYAVKIFRSEDEEMFIHAEREFKIMNRLKGHPNIVQGVDYIPELLRSRGYLVMERILGSSVADIVSDKGPLGESEAKPLVKQILEAVSFMHQNGVIHRDLNPTNIFCVDKMNVKILDFNVSKFIEKQPDDQVQLGKYKYLMFTKTGTPIYTAPEMHTRFRYTESIDLWGVGTIIYTLLTGDIPFSEQSIPKLVQKVMNAEYDRCSDQWKSLSINAQDLIQSLLCVDPDKRLTAEEALQHPWLSSL